MEAILGSALFKLLSSVENSLPTLWLSLFLSFFFCKFSAQIRPQLGFPLEKEMATHSSILACRIPWTEEPGRLQPVYRVEESRTQLSD